MSVELKPLGDRILIKAVEKTEEVRSSGLIIPDSAKEKPQQGEVIATGRGKIGDDGRLIPMDVNVGDKVLYGKYSGTEIKLDGQQYLIMHQDDILGIVEEA